MTRLDEAAVAQALRAVPGWRREGRAIVRTYRFRDFGEAMGFVNRVAAVAERLEHHPDIAIQYNEVTLSAWTHSADGLTVGDFELARTIDATGAPA